MENPYMEIIYIDNRIIVCVKPTGVLSTDVPGGMPDLLKKELNCDCAKQVHRLDAKVHGIMIYARSNKAASILSQQIRNHTFHKNYLAIVHGVPPKEGTLVDYLYYDKSKRMTIVSDENNKEAKECILKYRVICSKDNQSLLSIDLITGRTHQIRCQLSNFGYPIIGDQKYGNPEDGEPIYLCSHMISFLHPQTENALSFSFEPKNGLWDIFLSSANIP